MKWAVIDEQTHVVKNIIAWDGVTSWSPPPGHYVRQDNYVNIGDEYDQENQRFNYRNYTKSMQRDGIEPDRSRPLLNANQGNENE